MTVNDWRALPMTVQHTMRDGLHVRDEVVATVEAFSDDGPWYGNALALDGSPRHSGAVRTPAAAAEWCEETSGHSASSVAPTP